MKIEKGMYVRTTDGYIAKIRKIITDENIEYFMSDIELPTELSYELEKEDIKKASFNIIDLIEVGDYVNGRLVIRVRKNSLGVLLGYRENRNEKNDIHIKTIVTHEQFDNIKYEVK